MASSCSLACRPRPRPRPVSTRARLAASFRARRWDSRDARFRLDLCVALTLPFPLSIAGGSGGGGGSSGKRSRNAASLSPRSLGTLVSERSAAVEVEASVAFLQLAHNAFPAASFLTISERLVFSSSRRPIANRVFSLSDEALRAAFLKSRDDFIRTTLDPPVGPAEEAPVAAAGERRLIDFSPEAQYASRDFEKLQMDLIVKLPLQDVCEWTRDDTVTRAGEPLSGGAGQPFFIRPSSQQAVPGRPAPPVPASMARAVSGSSFSAEHYPADAAAYVVAEVYSPLGEGDARLAQKLLQAERVVRFLAAKEGKESVRDCVLGFVFMGPSIDSSAGAALFNALKHHRARLPCLWALQESPCRLLGCQVVIEPLVVTLFLSRLRDRERDQRDRERDKRDRERDQRDREREQCDCKRCALM